MTQETRNSLPHHPDWLPEGRGTGKLILQPRTFRRRDELLTALRMPPPGIDKTEIEAAEQALVICWSQMQNMLERGGGISRDGILGITVDVLRLTPAQQEILRDEVYVVDTVGGANHLFGLTSNHFHSPLQANISLFAPETHTKVGFNTSSRRRWEFDFYIQRTGEEILPIIKPTLDAFADLTRTTFANHGIPQIVGPGTAVKTFLYDLSFTTGLNSS